MRGCTLTPRPGLGKNYRIVGFGRVRKYHRHSGCFRGNDKRAEVLPKALDFGFGAYLLVRLFCYFRHATGRSICFAGNSPSNLAKAERMHKYC